VTEKPLSKTVAAFVRFHLYDKNAFAPFTGQDLSAWNAFLYALELYGRADAYGQTCAISALRSCLFAAQRKDDVRAVFQKSIPGVLDWGYEEKLWAEITDDAATPRALGTKFPASPGPRVCAHVRSKPVKKRPGWWVCTDRTCRTEWRLADTKGDAA
jgi:hypothetical protein